MTSRSPAVSFAVAIAFALVSALVVGSAALSQDQSAAKPKDTIFARKILMSTIGTHMDEIGTMAATGKIDLNEGREHADTISVMLLAFPHLFPPPTNQWRPNVDRDPGTDTYAAPEVWTRFADFYRQAADASEIALKASRADTDAEFKALVDRLQAACNGCHAAFLKTD
jgi:cytochrome c556